VRSLLLRAAPAPTAERGQGAVTFTFLGTAGFTVETTETALALDPYLTRAGILGSLFGRLVPDAAAIRRAVPRCHGVLVGHSHHDHALDAPELCRQTGAPLLGSRATAYIAEAAGLPAAQVRVVEPGRAERVGTASATALRSRHGKALLGRVPIPGDITTPPPWPPRMWNLKHGPVFHWLVELGGTRVLHVDSADFVDEELAEADVLCLCAIGRQYRRDYTRTLVERVKPSVVLPCHWDDFTVPLTAAPRQLPGVRVEEFVEEVRSLGARALVLSPMQSWSC
jgi:L-ascorbate metabolism protein UlaG (beta-lactamase superfamily)